MIELKSIMKEVGYMKKYIYGISVLIIIILIGIICFFNSNKKTNSNETIINKTFNSQKESDIKFDSKKINIYVFWGDGCPHCEELYTFLNNLDKKYKSYFNIYSFEVWNDEENNEFMNKIANKLNEETSGVPYMVIGKQTFSGYSSSMDKKIKKAILDEYNNNGKNDVYKNWN